MKYTFFFLFLFCAIIVKAQEYDLSFVNHTQGGTAVYFAAKEKNDLTKAYKQTPYWKKYKIMKGCAWGVLGVGVCGMGVGFLGALANTVYTNANWKEDQKPFNVIFYTSLGVTLSSIPLFIFANKNKKKAKRSVELSLSTSHIYMHLPNGRQQAKPALGLCINF